MNFILTFEQSVDGGDEGKEALLHATLSTIISLCVKLCRLKLATLMLSIKMTLFTLHKMFT